MKPYAFSGWIANLGVVPLFSFAFFLLAPAFFLFNFLRILVCVVLEDIFLSLSYQFNKQYRAIFLTCFLLLVKGFIAQSTAFASASSKQKNIFLAKGEQIELDINNLDSFSIGNSEVVQCKYLSKTKKFLVKGKMLGFSDLIIKSGEDQIYHIYVTICLCDIFDSLFKMIFLAFIPLWEKGIKSIDPPYSRLSCK